MTWGIPMPLFLGLHVALSLLGIATGLVVLFGMVNARHLSGWVVFFLVATFLTGVTGFPLAPFGLDPPRIVGVILLCLLALAFAGLYVFALAGAWPTVYVGCSIGTLFECLCSNRPVVPDDCPPHALAPTQSDPLFALSQVVALAVFVVPCVFANRRFAMAGIPRIQPA
jgi:hypothetical protein